MLFEEALDHERVLLEELGSERAGDPEWTDARIADEAYRRTWLEGSFAETLGPVRPPRETAAAIAAQHEQAKANNKANKKLEASEKQQLEASRKEGVAGREALKADIDAGPDSGAKMQRSPTAASRKPSPRALPPGDLATEHAGDPEVDRRADRRRGLPAHLARGHLRRDAQAGPPAAGDGGRTPRDRRPPGAQRGGGPRRR